MNEPTGTEAGDISDQCFRCGMPILIPGYASFAAGMIACDPCGKIINEALGCPLPESPTPTGTEARGYTARRVGGLWTIRDHDGDSIAWTESEGWAKTIAQRMNEGAASGTEGKVCQLIASRQQRGLAKYGTSLADAKLSLREILHHAMEEAADLTCYLMRAIEEIDRQADENKILRAILRDQCYSTVHRPEFTRKGYSVLIDPDTALRDIEYRDAALYEAPDAAIDAAIEYYREAAPSPEPP